MEFHTSSNTQKVYRRAPIDSNIYPLGHDPGNVIEQCRRRVERSNVAQRKRGEKNLSFSFFGTGIELFLNDFQNLGVSLFGVVIVLSLVCCIQ